MSASTSSPNDANTLQVMVTGPGYAVVQPTEEQQRHDLMLMFPDLQLSPGTTEPDRARSASPRSDSIQF